LSTESLVVGTLIDAENPWPGLSAFDETAQRFFSGRDAESAELLRLVGQAPLTVLFGKSGLGKTSLVQAGLFPRLRQQNILPVYVRLNVRDRSAPLIQQAAAALQSEVGKHGVDSVAPNAGESLWEHLHGRHVEWWSTKNQPLTPVFVFDQFEEAFTLGAENADAIERLRFDLADLIENRIPAELAQRIEAGGSAEHLDLRGQRYKVLISFREDFLPEVEGWKSELPSLMRNRLRLLPMSADRALQVVSGKTPAGKTHSLVTDETAREIVRFVAAVQTGDEKTSRGQSLRKGADPPWDKMELEPALLSLVCEGLNEKRKARAQSTIDAALLKETGAAIIGDFYQRCVADVPEKTRRFIEDALITEGGFRNSYPLQDALDQGQLTEPLLRQLVDRRLLRIDHQFGADRVELIHDRLTAVVREHRDKERERIRAQRQRRMRWAVGSVVVLLSAIVGVFFLLWQDARKAEEQTRTALVDAEVAKKKALGEKERADTAAKHAEAATEQAVNSLKETEQAKEQEARAAAAAKRAAEAAKVALRDAIAGKLAMQSRAILDGQRVATIDIALLLGAAGYRLNANNETYSILDQALRATSSIVKLAVLPEPVIAISPDGRMAVTQTETDSNRLRLWDTATGYARGVPLQGHTKRVQSVAFSPDGKTLVSGSADATLRMWDAATGQPRGAPLQGHTGEVWTVAYSPDGRTLVSGSFDNTLRLWDANTGQSRGEPMQGHPRDRKATIAFSPDSGVLVSSGSGNTSLTSGNDGTLYLWDATSGLPLNAPLEGHKNMVASVAFSPTDGKTFVSASWDGTLRLWDGKTGQPLGAPLKHDLTTVASVAFSPDGRTLVSGGGDQTLRLWDVATKRLLDAIKHGHTRTVSRVAFSPDGKTLISAAADGTFHVMQATGWLRSAPPQGSPWHTVQFTFSPDGKTLVSGGADGTMRLWDIGGQPRGAPLPGHTTRVFDFAFSSDGKTVVSASYDATLRLFDAATGKPRGGSLKGHTEAVTTVAFSPDGKTLASGSWDKTLRLWDAATGQPRGASLKGHTDNVLGVAFSPDGKTLASGSSDKTLRLWDTATGQPRGAPLQGSASAVFGVAFSPDGNTLVSGSDDHTLRLWDAKTGRPRGAPLQGHTDQLRIVAFSPDGKILVSGGLDHTLRFWDAATGQPRGLPLRGHTGAVKTIAFSHDGKFIVSGSNDRTLRLWDATGRPVSAPLQGHASEVLSVTFSADGKTILSVGGDNMVRVWDAPAAWIDRVCAKLVRNLSREEWAQYVGDIPYVEQCPGLPVQVD
jgi:WD40 repeat protein